MWGVIAVGSWELRGLNWSFVNVGPVGLVWSWMALDGLMCVSFELDVFC